MGPEEKAQELIIEFGSKELASKVASRIVREVEPDDLKSGITYELILGYWELVQEEINIDK